MQYMLLLSLIITLLPGCKPAPTYNPFDEVFEVRFSRSELQLWDTIWVECGYYNLTLDLKDHQIYYQYFIEEPQVLAKGLELVIDTITSSITPTKQNADSLFTTMHGLPIDTNRIDLIFSAYGLMRQPDEVTDDIYWYFCDQSGNKFQVEVLLGVGKDDYTYIRTASVFTAKKKLKL